MKRISILPRLVAALVAVLLATLTAPASAIPDDPLPHPCERPKPPPHCFAGTPTGTLTTLSRTPAGIIATGSAQDPDASGPVRIAIDVDGRFAGELSANGAGGAFSGTVPPRAGNQVCVWAINQNQGDDALLGCRRLEVRLDPLGHLDEVMTTAGGLRVRGWVIDPDTTAPAQVRLLVDGRQRQEVTASADRPDVGAAYPGYGNAHGFDLTLPGSKRHTSVCAFGVNVGPGTVNTRLGCGRDPHAVSIFNLNVEGTHDEWQNDDGVGTTSIPWRDRYARLATWMANNGTLPDLITLQEVPARKQYWLPVPHHEPPDYESLFVLIDQINRRTGARYRIAYLSADYVHEGWQPLYQGRALIYNADRVHNTTALVNSWAVAHDDTTVTGVHMRASWPCAAPSAKFASSCSLIDLDGRHWASSYTNPQTRQWVRGPQAAVFELVSDPGKHIIVVNVHALRCQEPSPRSKECLAAERTDQLAIRSLVDQVWSAWAPRTKLIPPIVAGDFNGGVDMPTSGGDGSYEPTLPDFETTATENVDFVIAGNPSTYPSVYTPSAETELFPSRTPYQGTTTERPYCGTVATVLADHCAIFAQYLPTS
jgi:hypothetical protein